MLDRIASLRQDQGTLVQRERVPIAELRDRQATDELHHEVGAAAVSDAAIDRTRDARMVDQRHSPSLMVEARKHRLGVHPQLDQLDRDLLLEGPLAHRAPHRAEPAVADLIDEAVGADLRAGSFEGGAIGRRGSRINRMGGFHDAVIRPCKAASSDRSKRGTAAPRHKSPTFVAGASADIPLSGAEGPRVRGCRSVP